MDWALAIKRNREQLKDIVLALFGLAGMRVGGRTTTLPRSTFTLIMLVLRPAESAVRRLIVIVAHGLVLKPREPREALMGSLSNHEGLPPTRAFALFDPLKSFDADSIWGADPTYESGYSITKSITWLDTSTDQTPTDARSLALRLNALMRALNDLPRQARRLKRWELRRNQRLSVMKPTRMSPMRPGLPPGWRERTVHEIDEVLKECHRLALDRVNAPDSS